ncbi:hypothetical protein [Tautonia marina]|uniref:hypothetical protein n=1 Tax=Tautonia marina TaxID=2653855 RepID=UPI001261164E|nr:hypothetical protein [Tautonia marina]
MTTQQTITYKVWIDIEEYNEETGQGVETDAPGGALAAFDTCEEAWAYAAHVTQLACGEIEQERICKAAPKLLSVLERAEFLMRRISEGDHHALENLGDAAEQARAAIADATAAGIRPKLPDHSTCFAFTHEPEKDPDRACVHVEGGYGIAIIRNPEGLIIDVYPNDWMEPIETLTVWNDDVAVAESDDDAA